MGENSKIEWTKHSANLWWGCVEVHAGCDNCYARVWSERFGNELWGSQMPRMEVKSVWKNLAKFQKLAAEAGEMHRVFIGSMMDIFEKPMTLVDKAGNFVMHPTLEPGQPVETDYLRDKLFTEISQGKYNNLMFLFLTKRPSNINKYIPEEWKTDPPKNVMFGTSTVDQKTANKLIPQLLKVNGKRFLSIEPMLGEINLRHLDADNGGDPDWCQIDCLTGRHTDMARPCPDVPKIDWIICGGESGSGRRPFDVAWARGVGYQCSAAGVPFFMKQVDKVIPIPSDLMIRQFYS